ncbi:MAG TPA: hypothetical protein VFT74_20220 [Isosphaeraceae bacterium]|nr:hypothetical protein [Isosphaeraceae bacterium]
MERLRFVVQDAKSYQRLLELAAQAERMEALRVSIQQMRAGKAIPADDVLADMRRILEKARSTKAP